jgi:hypothetical protein
MAAAIMKNNNNKTEEELMQDLKKNGKYENWVKNGKFFGLIDRRIHDPTRIKYIYRDAYNNNVTLCEITRTFTSDKINIPVLNYVGKDMGSHVSQATYRIVNSTEMLSTSGLATCTALSMTIGKKKFLAHLDAGTKIGGMLISIKNAMEEEKITSCYITNIKIYAGSGLGGGSEQTVIKAKAILDELNITKNIQTTTVFYMDTIII